VCVRNFRHVHTLACSPGCALACGRKRMERMEPCSGMRSAAIIVRTTMPAVPFARGDINVVGAGCAPAMSPGVLGMLEYLVPGCT